MILCLDLETTGLDEQRCGLLQIGAVWLHGGEFFTECSVSAGTLIEAEALRVNGCSLTRATDPALLPERLAVIEFLGWARAGRGHGSIQLAAWNAHFDHRHLHAALERAGVPAVHRPFTHRLLDLHSLVAGDQLRARYVQRHPHRGTEQFATYGDDVRSADDGARLLGLPPESRPHHALTGARQVRALLRRFLGERDALPA